MSRNILWQPMLDALDRWAQSGRVADLWLRDDDAVEPTEPLERLLDLTRSHAVPLALAVIPAHSGAALAARLAGEPHVSVLVHGWSHDNHAPPGEKKQELGPHRPRGLVLDELAAAHRRLASPHGRSFVPVLVPPWNRIDPGLLPELSSLGFAALSVFGQAKPAPLPVVNTHVDLIDWHGHRGARDAAALARDLATALDCAYEGRGEPLGFLTHHLVHDEAGRDFLAELFALTGSHPACRWRAVRDVLAWDAGPPT